MPFTLRQLEYFVRTCETGSVTIAARREDVSQSTISAAVAQLERSLGLELLVRHHARGVSPTPAGRRFLGEANALLRHAGDLERFASELADEVKGRLELGCLVTLAPVVAPGLCAAFRREHPKVETLLVESGQAELLARLRGGELSVALTYDLELGDDIDFEALAQLPPHAVLPVGHPLAGQAEVSLAELAPEPFVLLDLPLSREYFRSLFLSAGLAPNVAHRSEHPEVIRSLVANGFGYTLVNVLPRTDRALDGRRVATVPLATERGALALGLASLGAVRDTRTVAAFREHCRRAIGPGGIPGTVASGQQPSTKG